MSEHRGDEGAQWITRALAEGRLTVFAQAIIDARSGDIVRHELLVRGLDDDGQLVLPYAFIPAAERVGLMPELDRWVVERGLEFAAAGVPVAINLSAQSLNDVAPLATMVRSSARAGMDPADVMFEVTETAAIADLRVGYRALRALHELGCPLALDDFGTGFGCFSYLKHVPAQFVKIDREFIRGICHDSTDLAITTAIAGLAAELGMETVAEGVEDAETLEAVAAAGVRYAQGYFIGRPAPMPGADRIGRRQAS